jgi:hypothetical protein
MNGRRCPPSGEWTLGGGVFERGVFAERKLFGSDTSYGDPVLGQTPCGVLGLVWGNCREFCPASRQYMHFLREISGMPPGYAAEDPDCGEKVLELWLRRSALGVPLLWPVERACQNFSQTAVKTASSTITHCATALQTGTAKNRQIRHRARICPSRASVFRPVPGYQFLF